MSAPQESFSATITALSSAGPRRRARIEIIPLIDVIFFLLATFVLFTLSLNKSDGLSVALPTAASGEPRDPTGAATITLTAENTLAWNKEPVTHEQFIARLQVYKKTAADPRLIINGDAGALSSQARYVVDEVRRAGFSKILIETRVVTATP
ncbi:MAG: biopolymer transporter ExbD [Verrucomicrobiota bacterium]